MRLPWGGHCPPTHIVNVLRCIVKKIDTYNLSAQGGSKMSEGSVFKNNRTQAVRLPVDMRFPEGVKKVFVRAIGKERIITPVESTWDSFFLSKNKVTDDFLTERASQAQPDREAF
jgi:antitoxin VapB